MADEQEPIAEAELTSEQTGAEVETPDPVEAKGTEPETTDEGTQAAEDEGAEQVEDDLDTVDVDGTEYQVPKALKARIMMHKDYTQKTQEIAETRKALEVRQAEIEQQAEVTDEDLNARASLQHINKELERFKDWDFAQYQQARQLDPMGADEAWAYKQHLANQKAALSTTLSERQQERTQKSQQDFAKRLEETRTFAKTKLKGWTPEADKKVLEFIREKQIPEDFVRKNMSPQFYEILYTAQLGEQLLAKQADKPKPQPAAKPLTRVAAKSNPAPQGLHDGLSDDEWVKRRNKQLAGRA